MAIPKPDPKDWLTAAADELRLGDRETLKLLQNAYRNVNQILKGLPDAPDAPFGNLIYRAQLERVKRRLLDQALAVCPDCYQVRVVYMFGIRPRWGGSHEMMEAFAAERGITFADQEGGLGELRELKRQSR